MPVAKDAYGFALHYYGQNDYKPIGGVRPFANADTGIVDFKPLYNGNIAAMAVNIPKVGEPLLYNYSYDQLNRITGMDAYRGLNVVSNTWTPISTTSFKEAVKYDPNGNILGYLRNGNNLIGKPLAMDSMNYHYKPGTNQLDYISDLVAKGNYKEDIDNQQIHNYVYDSIGNLIRDNAEKISSIDWTVYGKISRIVKTDTTEISYIYDAAGQRIAKAVKKNNITDSTYYVRDASGNVMSVYERNDTVSRGHVIQKEIDLYGSSRLGMLIAETDVDSIVPLTTTAYFVRGKKRYELTNHLGNVLVVISDVKKPIRSLTDTTLVIGYEPKVVTATDYYPFGMQMPGRHGFATESGDWHGSYAFAIPPHLIVNHRGGNLPGEYVASQVVELSDGFETGVGNDNYVAYIADEATMAVLDSAYQLVGGGYRYGFNGMEEDRDIQGSDYDYKNRIYDPKSGKFLSIDPITSDYPELTPYQFASNRPVEGIDLDGLEFISRKAENEYFHRDPILSSLLPAPQPTHATPKPLPAPTHNDNLRAKPNPAKIPQKLPETHVAAPDMFGNGIIGPKSVVEENLAIQKQAYYNKVGEDIASSPFGSAGYLIDGDRGAALGAAVGQVMFSFGGVSGKGFLSKPELNVETEPALSPNVTLTKLQSQFENLAATKLLPKYQKLDPNLKAGYTGSFSTGSVGNPSKSTFGQPVNLSCYDIDFFIQSDVLYQKFGKNLRADPEFRKILSETPGFEGLKDNKAGFSIKFTPSSSSQTQ